MKKYKLYTIGYEKRDIEEFIEILKANNIDLLLDIRERAWSYKKDFCKTRLGNKLKRKGIQYIHIREAGNPKEYRQKANTIHECLLLYKEYLKRTESGLSEIKSVVANNGFNNVCLMCFERDSELCHRSILVKKIKNIKDVNHL